MLAWLLTTTETTGAAVSTTTSALVNLPLITKGLLTTLFGLVGVFMVLVLFFFAIKLMQHFGEKQENVKGR